MEGNGPPYFFMAKKTKVIKKNLDVLEEQYKKLSKKMLRLKDKDGNAYYCNKDMIRIVHVDGKDRRMVMHSDTTLLPKTNVVYNQGMADAICEGIMEGKTLTAICKEEYMPGMTTIHKWARLNEDFANQMDHALRFSAYANADKVQDVAEAEDLDTDTDIKRAQMKLSSYKWRAERLNPDRFGPSTKVKNEGGPEIVVVNTGINRETIEVDSKVKQDLIENDKDLD